MTSKSVVFLSVHCPQSTQIPFKLETTRTQAVFITVVAVLATLHHNAVLSDHVARFLLDFKRVPDDNDSQIGSPREVDA